MRDGLARLLRLASPTLVCRSQAGHPGEGPARLIPGLEFLLTLFQMLSSWAAFGAQSSNVLPVSFRLGG